MRNFFYSMAGVGLLWALLSSQTFAAGPEGDVQAKLAAQNQWLGTGATASGWQSYLKTADLETQLGKGQTADKAVVAAVLAQYRSGAAGLDRPQFVAVRQALEAWQAQLAVPSVAELPAALAKAKETLAPPTAERLASSKKQAQDALAKLDAYLARGGQATQQGWHTYFDWPQLAEQLNKVEAPNAAALDNLVNKFYQNEKGLERPQFLAARQALETYKNDLLLANEPDWKAALAARLDEVTKRLAAYQTGHTDDEAVALGQQLAWLNSSPEGKQLAQAVRQHYVLPNFHLFASQRLAAAGVKDQVNDVSPVRENILDTDIHGTAHTVGQITLRTVPSSERAILEILMSGQSYSRNVGYNGPVTIYSRGYTDLSAYKRVFFDETGLHPQPAVAVAKTDTTITGIGAKHKIVRKIAEKQIAGKSGQAEAIASQRAERRLENRIDTQAAEMLAKTQATFDDKFRLPLLRKGHFPETLKFSTTADGFRVTALHATPVRFGAPTEAPKLIGQHDLAVRVHESLVGNAGETVLGGLTLTDEKLAELMKEITGEVPEELQISEDKDPWSMTFAAARPIAVEFTGNTCTIAIHGNKFTRGDQDIKRNMRISAKYKLEQSGNGSKLTRDGDVNVDYVDNKGQLSVSQVAFKTFLRRKFSSLFKPEIANDGLKLPGRWERAGKLTLRQLEADKGWLTLGWELPEEPRTASADSKF